MENNRNKLKWFFVCVNSRNGSGFVEKKRENLRNGDIKKMKWRREVTVEGTVKGWERFSMHKFK